MIRIAVMPRSDRVDIVFTSRLIELLSAEELKFVVAHGYIKSIPTLFVP